MIVDSPFSLPITAQEVAGIRLGDAESWVLEHLGVPISRQRATNTITAESLHYGSLLVHVDNHAVDLLMALDGYRGCTAQGIQVSTTYAELLERGIQLCFDLKRRAWILPEEPRIEIELADRIDTTNEFGENWVELLEDDDPKMTSFVASMTITRDQEPPAHH